MIPKMFSSVSLHYVLPSDSGIGAFGVITLRPALDHQRESRRITHGITIRPLVGCANTFSHVGVFLDWTESFFVCIHNQRTSTVQFSNSFGYDVFCNDGWMIKWTKIRPYLGLLDILVLILVIRLCNSYARASRQQLYPS